MMQSPRYVRRTYSQAAMLVLIVAALFALGIIDVTFGGLLIAGAILLLALALLSRVAEWPNLAALFWDGFIRSLWSFSWFS